MEIGSDAIFKEILIRHQLNDFDALWALEGELVEEGNIKEKSGHSHVVRLSFPTGAEPIQTYMKKQTNYATTLSRMMHRTQSICRREYSNIQRWHQLNLPTLEALYCAEVKNPLRGILITRALEGYMPLDDYLGKASPEQRTRLLAVAARLVRRIHQSGWVHRCLFPKHVFVCLEHQTVPLKMIDLEKARRAWLGMHDHVRDLSAFVRRIHWSSTAECEQFLNIYTEGLHPWHAQLLKYCVTHRIARRRLK
jgi:hypothetical protein